MMHAFIRDLVRQFGLLGGLAVFCAVVIVCSAGIAQVVGIGAQAVQGFAILSQPSGGGFTKYHYVVTGAANQDLQAVASGSHQIYAWNLTNTNASPIYLKIFDAASGCTGGTPVISAVIPGNISGAGNNYAEAVGIPVSTGICIRVTTQLADGADATASLSASTAIIDMRYN